MDQVITFGLICPNIMEIGSKIKYQGMEFINGQMEDHMKANGRQITCMEKANILGKMEEFIKVSILMIRNMALALILGQMVVAILANGVMENKTDRANIYFLME